MRWIGIIGLLLVSSVAQAAIEHISLNRLELDQSQTAHLYLNVVGDSDSVRQLQFYLQQGETKTMVRHNAITYFQLMIEVDRDAVPTAQLLASTLVHVSDDALGRFDLASAPVVEKRVAAVIARPQQQPKKATKPLPPQQDIEKVVAVKTSAQNQAKARPKSKLSSKVGSCSLQPKETLWRAGERLAAEFGLGRYGMMMALFDANPEKFNGNPQRMRSGSLTCPNEAKVQRWGDEAFAKKQFKMMSQQ